ncbi:MAG TPA: YfhO family protein, partial [Thermomicrobiales bacterium]|nr:YfhO family protein [Thermomicrobiales bacterium]
TGTGSRLLDLLDVRYALVDAALPQNRPDVVALANGGRKVFANDHVIVYERQPDARRAWIVHDVRAAKPGETLAPLASGAVDPFKTAFVEGAPPPAAKASGQETATVTRDDGDTISVAVNATAPGLLVLSEPYANGWQATVDDKPVAIVPTDLLLRGVPIPAGEHRVTLRYAPAPLRIGLAISAAAGAAMLATLAWAGWRRVRPGA